MILAVVLAILTVVPVASVVAVVPVVSVVTVLAWALVAQVRIEELYSLLGLLTVVASKLMQVPVRMEPPFTLYDDSLFCEKLKNRYLVLFFKGGTY